jgi:hypothetical protein
MQQQVNRLVIGDVPHRQLYEPVTKSYVKVRDAREGGGNRAASRSVIEAFLENRRSIIKPLSGTSGEFTPAGGALSAGVVYGDSLLHFQDNTAIYFHLVAPPTIGVQTNAEVLYMTSSNCANHGCEALLSFAADEEFRCVFGIWDWAHPDMPGGGKFVKNYSYDELSQYLIACKFTLESGQELDTVCVYIANVTRRTDSNQFQNEVYLQNNVSGTLDLMWSYAFLWPDKDQPNSKDLWWGPIFETYPNPGAQFALQSPVGFDQAVLMQDGNQYQLTDQDCTLTLPNGNGLRAIYRSPGKNSGLLCSSGADRLSTVN